MCGPLWAYSNFVFEGNNGSLVKYVQGTTDVECQIAVKYWYKETLNKTLNAKSVKSTKVKISEKIGLATLLGNPRLYRWTESNVSSESDILIYKKFVVRNEVFYVF